MSDAIRTMFDSIAHRYDRANNVLSMGRHRAWRRRTVKWAGAKPGDRALDVATGTGDLAFELERAVGAQGEVTGVDFSREMIEGARAKAKRRRSRVQFRMGDALHLPFPTAAFDLSTIGFGIRNVDDPVQCLQEMARVVRPGGAVAVLEFGRPEGWRARPFEWYSRVVIPRVGRMLTGNREAYEYLPRTAAAFPAGDAFMDLVRRVPELRAREAKPLSGGIAYVYLATVA